jgi:hypothetical protein
MIFFTNMPPQIIIIRLILTPFNATSNTKSPSTRGQQPPQKKNLKPFDKLALAR